MRYASIVLGDVISTITSLSYNDLLIKYIEEPIGGSTFSAPSYLFEAPGGLARSTIYDMALFARGVLNDVYVSRELKMDTIWQPLTVDAMGNIGLGWYLTNHGTDSLAVFHAGSNGIPRAFISLRPNQSLGIVILGKQRNSDGEQLFYHLARRLMQEQL